MRKIRWLFALFGAAFLVLILLLLQRSLQSVEIERRLQHKAVADRVFDEMERELSALLESEEGRPFSHYRSFFMPADNNALAPARSPLANRPSKEYIVGYYQINPDGDFQTPHLAPAPGEKIAAFDDQRLHKIEAAARQHFTKLRATTRPPGKTPEKTSKKRQQHSPQQQEGTTIALQLNNDGNSQAYSEDALLKQEAVKNESSLRGQWSLNRASKSRNQRATQSQGTSPYNLQDNFPSKNTALVHKNRTKAKVEVFRETEFLKQVSVRVEPMMTQRIGTGELLLYRNAQVGQQSYVQGLLVDIPALARWLTRSTVENSELLSYAQVFFQKQEEDPLPQLPTSAYLFRHRFAQPFQNLTAILSLRPLPGLGETKYLNILSILLLLVATLGMYALYRMVAVTVAFAERRNNFVSAVTHELKTPLTAIRMYGEMLQENMVSSEDKRYEYYQHITSESERLTRLINNVLELSRLEKGGRSLNLVAQSPLPVLQEVQGIMTPHAHKQGFELRMECQNDLPAVRYDRDALLQVLLNLIDNAIKYAGKSDKKVVEISCENLDGRIQLSVRDHGPGITAKHLGKVFEPFYRGENELTRTSTGTGIGLALVKGLVERMQGSVRVDNADGGGCRVVITLSTPANC